MSDRVTIKDLPDHLLSQGRYSATTVEIAELVGCDPAYVRQGLKRLRERGKVFSPARGLWVFVPPEYRSWGVLPAVQFIDDLMLFLKVPYYVGLLSAAELHGAAHQRPQAFQVVTGRHVADRDIHRVRLRFYESGVLPGMPFESRNTPTGTIRVSTREATAIDLVDRSDAAGGLGNVATVLTELGPLDGDELARLAALHPRSLARRLGWMLERFSAGTDLSPLLSLAGPGLGTPAPLARGAPRRGQIDPSWHLWLNTTVESDLP